jgi:hypothetical protein
LLLESISLKSFYTTFLQFTSEEKVLELQAAIARLEGDVMSERDKNRSLVYELQEAEGAVEAKEAVLRGKNEQLDVLRVIFFFFFLLLLSIFSCYCKGHSGKIMRIQ